MIEVLQSVQKDCARLAHEMSEQLVDLENTTLMITGGSGFMGSWICEMVNFLNEHENRKIKLFVLARDRDLFEKKLPHIVNSKSIEFIRCDVRSIVDIPKEVNYVIHAAGSPDNRFHASSPIETMTSIADGTAAVLNAANRVSDLRKFVNVSSSSVYAGNFDSSRKIDETYPGIPLGLQVSNAYSEAKRYAEALCSAARSEARIPVVNIRPFTFCGPYQELDTPWALNNFINDAIFGRPIRILGDGETVRSYLYGADLAAWVLIIMLKSKVGGNYNIGSDVGYSLAEIANKVANCFQSSPDIILNASLTGTLTPTSLVPDTGLVTQDLGIRQITDIDTAIQKTVDWYKKSQDVHSEKV